MAVESIGPSHPESREDVFSLMSDPGQGAGGHVGRSENEEYLPKISCKESEENEEREGLTLPSFLYTLSSISSEILSLLYRSKMLNSFSSP